MLTARAHLFHKGLAKSETGRGRFSDAAHEELERARAAGVKFSDDAPKGEKPKTVKAPKAATVKMPKADTSKVDPAAVRKWAKDNGITVGARGRIHEDVKAQYLAGVAPEQVEEREGEFDVYAPTAPHAFPVETLFKGSYTFGGKVHSRTVNAKSACVNCRVSLVGCRCGNPTVVSGVGGTMKVEPIRKG